MIAVIWIDWYAYHNARFRALAHHPLLRGNVMGIELVGGVGVHSGLKFRESRPGDLPVITLAPEQGWREAGQWKLARLLWEQLDRLTPSTLLIPGYYTLPGLAAAIWGKLRGCCTVLMTESTEHDHARSAWKEKLKSLAVRYLFDWAVAGGSPHVRYLQQLRFPPERICRFYDVVDNEFFSGESARLRLENQALDFGLPKNYFLYVGRLSPEKNIDGLIRSFAEYRQSGGFWSLVLAGDGPQAPFLKRLADELGVSGSVHFSGLQPSQKLPEFYAFARCFVLPSSREPWGLVVNEAMAASLPVIVSSRCGCAEDLVAENENGFVFDPSQAGALTKSLQQMSALPDELREQMSTASRERISRYSPREWAAEVAKIDQISRTSFRGTEAPVEQGAQ